MTVAWLLAFFLDLGKIMQKYHLEFFIGVDDGSEHITSCLKPRACHAQYLNV